MQKFTQIKEYLLELSFLALLIRLICVGAGIGEALAVISLVLSMAYNKWLTKEKLSQYEELKNQSETNYKELKSLFVEMQQDYGFKLENLMSKFSNQNLEQALIKKGPELDKILQKLERIEKSNGTVSNEENQTKRRLF